jgi:hypothetical protein
LLEAAHYSYIEYGLNQITRQYFELDVPQIGSSVSIIIGAHNASTAAKASFWMAATAEIGKLRRSSFLPLLQELRQRASITLSHWL